MLLCFCESFRSCTLHGRVQLIFLEAGGGAHDEGRGKRVTGDNVRRPGGPGIIVSNIHPIVV